VPRDATGTTGYKRQAQKGVWVVRIFIMLIAALSAITITSAAAMAAQPATSPVPGPPVAYVCEATGEAGIWDDQFYPDDLPLCDVASENFLLCLAKYGQFQIETPSVALFATEIVGMYLAAGAGAAQGKCLPQPRSYWLCYGTAATSIQVLDEVSAIRTLLAGARVPHASKTINTGTKVGDHYLTCDDQGQKPTGRVISTGNGGEVVNGPASIGAGLLLTNPLDYTIEIG
jgi:hypothetical protein